MTQLISRSLIAMAVFVSLPLLPTYAETYHWTYEGDVIPNAATSGLDPNVSTDGNILTVDFIEGSRSERDIWSYAVPEAANAADTWTLDARFARSSPPGTWGASGWFPPYVDLYTRGTGTAGRVLVVLGRFGTGGGDGGDPPFDDSSTLSIFSQAVGAWGEVVVPGLDIQEMNNYRIVGTGGGTFRIYVNDIVTPIYGGTSTSTANDAFLTVAALYQGETSTSDMNMLVDFVRFNSDTAYDIAPIPPTLVQPGDFDGDGDVDGADFVVWQTNFPTTSSASIVPEPSSATLAAIGLLVIVCRSRRCPKFASPVRTYAILCR